jgi:hypothetical protein
MHAMAYGVPVITHDDLCRQMPEVEAIHPPISGQLFRHGNVDSLCRVMSYYLESGSQTVDSEKIIRVIEEAYTPSVQCKLIERALDRILKVERTE